MNKELLRDAITVSLMRSAGLDKHKARECADVVAAVLAAIDAPEQEPVADLTDEDFDRLCRDHQIYGTAEARLCRVFWQAAQKVKL